MICPACFRSSVFLKDHSLFNAGIYKCEFCGLCYTDVVDRKEIDGFYEREYSNSVRDKPHPGSAQTKRAKFHFDLLEKRVGDFKDKTILDVGCGNGEFLKECSLRGVRAAFGVDLDPMAAKTAMEYSGFPVLGGRLGGVESSQCDILVASHVLERADDPRGFVYALWALAKEHVLIEVPIEKPNDKAEKMGRVSFFAVMALLAILDPSFFEIISLGESTNENNVCAVAKKRK